MDSQRSFQIERVKDNSLSPVLIAMHRQLILHNCLVHGDDRTWIEIGEELGNLCSDVLDSKVEGHVAIVGSLSVGAISVIDGKVFSIFIYEDERRNGIGSALVKAALESNPDLRVELRPDDEVSPLFFGSPNLAVPFTVAPELAASA